MAWFQDIVAGLDLSAIKEPLQTVADTAHEALDAFDQAIAGVTVAVKGLFADVEGLVDQVDLSGLVTELENTLHDFTTQLETQLASLFSPVRDAVHDAVTSLDGVVDEFDPAQIVDVLNDLMSSLEGILDGAADAAKEIGDTLQQAADQIKDVSFAPITDEVIHEIDAVTDSLKAIDTSQLTPPLQLALQAALAVLPEDLDADHQPARRRLRPGGRAECRCPALDQLRGEPQKLLDQVKQFEPTTLIGDALSTPFQQLLQEMNAFKPSSLLDPVKQQLDQLKNRLKENVDPAKALAPLEAAVRRAHLRLRLAEARRDRQAAPGRNRLGRQRASSPRFRSTMSSTRSTRRSQRCRTRLRSATASSRCCSASTTRSPPSPTRPRRRPPGSSRSSRRSTRPAPTRRSRRSSPRSRPRSTARRRRRSRPAVDDGIDPVLGPLDERRPALEARIDRPREERRLAGRSECAARLAREDGRGRRARPLRPALGRLHAAVRVAPQPRARARRREDRRPRTARRRVGRELHRPRRRARRHARAHGRARGRPVGPRHRPEQLRSADERGLRADRAAGHRRRRRS